MNKNTLYQAEEIVRCLTVNKDKKQTDLAKIYFNILNLSGIEYRLLVGDRDKAFIYDGLVRSTDIVPLDGLIDGALDGFGGSLLIDSPTLIGLLVALMEDIKQADAENSALARRNADLLQQYHNLKSNSDGEISGLKKQLDEARAELETMRLATISVLENHELQTERTRSYIKHLESPSSVTQVVVEPIASAFWPAGAKALVKPMCEKDVSGYPEQMFIEYFNHVMNPIHATAKEKGWWDGERNDGELIALIHSELSEALEALRHGNKPDDKVPEFSGAEAELADTIIRIMDMCAARGWKVAEAIVAKANFNRGREHKHGGKAF